MRVASLLAALLFSAPSFAQEGFFWEPDTTGLTVPGVEFINHLVEAADGSVFAGGASNSFGPYRLTGDRWQAALDGGSGLQPVFFLTALADGRIASGVDDGYVIKSDPDAPWEHRTINGERVTGMVSSPDGGLYASTILGVTYSPDGGETWEARSPIWFYRLAHVESGTLFGSGPGGLRRSTDGGDSFDVLDAGHQTTFSGVPLEDAVAGVLYVGAYDQSHSSPYLILRSSDDGVTWTRVFRSATLFGLQGVSPTGHLLVSHGTDLLAVDPADGSSRLVFDGDSPLGPVLLTSDGRTLIHERERGTWISEDQAKWKLVRDGLRSPLPLRAIEVGPREIVLAQDGTLRERRDGAWVALSHPFVANSVGVAPDGTLFAGTSSGLYRQRPGETEWQDVSPAPHYVEIEIVLSATTVLIDVWDGVRQYALWTGDGGDTWAAPGHTDGYVAGVTRGAGGLYGMFQGNSRQLLHFSDDNGATWPRVIAEPEDTRGLYRLAGSPGSPLIGVWSTGVDSSAVYVSPDGGASWESVYRYRRAFSGVWGVVSAPGLLGVGVQERYAGGPSGGQYAFLVSRDDGATWTRERAPGPHLLGNTRDLHVSDEGRLYAATVVGLLRSRETFSTPSEPPPRVPRLAVDAWPNPAVGHITVRVAHEGGPLRIGVYDVLGREVATLLDADRRAAGEVLVRWSARGLSSGSYLVRVESGTERAGTRLSVLGATAR